MKRDYDPPRWNLIPMEPGKNVGVPVWDIVIISILGSMVVGVFIAAIVLGLEGSAAVAGV